MVPLRVRSLPTENTSRGPSVSCPSRSCIANNLSSMQQSLPMIESLVTSKEELRSFATPCSAFSWSVAQTRSIESLRQTCGLFKRVNERFIYFARSLAHTQLAGPICRNEAGVVPGALDLYERVACGGVNQLGMQQATVASGSATSGSQRNFSVVS